MNNDAQEDELRIVTKHEFYFETPLYVDIAIPFLERGIFGGDVDAYSSENHSDTTYDISIDSIDTWENPASRYSERIGFYLVTLRCKRKGNDTIRFVVFKNNEIVFKIGQWPSLADLQFAEIGRKYDKILPEEDLKNLKTAIGLSAHGVGAGSFVYLRRIFENLIFETYKNNSKTISLTELEFRGQRMMDKVETLKEFLPSQLVEMKSIYSILSDGVHELDEEECLSYFQPIKLSIELILDQKIEQEIKRKKDAAVKKQLQEIHRKISKNK